MSNEVHPHELHAPQTERRALIAYPLRYAQEDEQGRLTLDPRYAAELGLVPAAPATAEPQPGEVPPGGSTFRLPAPLWEMSLLLLVGTGVILLDQLTKRLIEASIPLYTQSIPSDLLYPYFRFTHTANYGAAFGLFQNGGLIFGTVAAVVAIAIIVYNFSLPPGQRLLRIALGLQLGGALGNLIDRLRLGYVTDFLDVDVSSIIRIPYISDWPVFNLADLSIVTGVVVLAFLMLTLQEEPQEQRQEAAPRVRIVPGDE